MGAGHPRIAIPRWIQLVGLPVLLESWDVDDERPVPVEVEIEPPRA